MTTRTATESPREAWQSAERIKSAWRDDGATPDAAAALRDHPSLAAHRSVVIDLVYEEYLLRERKGTPPEPAAFAQAFPDFQASVQDLIEAHCLLLAQPELLSGPEDDWPEVGSTLEGLELRRELGRGTFGRAYLGFDPALGRLRAVKLAPGGAAEARLIGGLNHPHVIDVLWTRPVGLRTAVCMPFVGSLTLSGLIERTTRRTPTAQLILDSAAPHAEEPPDSRAEPIVFARDSDLTAAAAIGAKLARAVAYLHEQSIVHGDIKPSNVILEPGGSPRLIDFNLAAGQEPAMAIRGTPAYMAPELLDATLAGRSPVAIDGQHADRFALGVTLWELLAGRHPYRGRCEGTLAALAVAVRRSEPTLSGLPDRLARLLNSSLAVDPIVRPPACEVAEALEQFVQRDRTRGSRRKKLAVAVLGSLALAGILAGATFARPETTILERPPESAAEFHTRGLAALHAGETHAARADFLTAHARAADPLDLALAAYCFSVTGEQRTAIAWNQRAIESGLDTPAVRNNLGASLVKTSAFEEAIEQLDIALARDPRMRAARNNRAAARYHLALKPAGRASLPLAIADIEDVLASGPLSAELHLDAARIYALAATTDSAYTERAIEQLERAVAAGQSPTMLRKGLIFRQSLSRHPRFAALLEATPGPTTPPLQLNFVEPSH